MHILNVLLCTLPFSVTVTSSMWFHRSPSCKLLRVGGLTTCDLPGHMAALCSNGPGCNHGLQSLYRPCHCHHSCLFSQEQHCLKPHHLYFHEQTGNASSLFICTHKHKTANHVPRGLCLSVSGLCRSCSSVWMEPVAL